MNAALKLFGFLFVSFLFIVSCDTPKKETDMDKKEIEQQDSSDPIGDQEEEPKDYGYEMAMSAYQCPMKCEGDKTYKENGDCPKCKMELKEIEVAENSATKEESTSH
ncbi:heavy metal-binding domain-containing protein [Lutimonas sp.]|uniref:heavy metal-binding domain-containing protein n=1 Tax=Lutimonas sp. TaxID=1872403 RepID=UPI003D9B0967